MLNEHKTFHAHYAALVLAWVSVFPSSVLWAFTFTPTTNIAALTANNTSASGSWTSNSSGDTVPGSVSTLPIGSLSAGGMKVIVETQAWFGSASHISVGYNSSDEGQVKNQVNDMLRRGISGTVTDWNG